MNNQGGNRFLDGFIVGLLIGGVAVFLLGTEKGKKVLKSLTENGAEGLTELLESFDSTETKKNLPKVVQKVEEKIEEKVGEIAPKETNGHSEKQAHRFFRRKS